MNEVLILAVKTLRTRLYLTKFFTDTQTYQLTQTEFKIFCQWQNCAAVLFNFHDCAAVLFNFHV
ncbi:hypothetical protein BOQ06_23920 [Klebsiella pneumoniae]|nr:hypothetical protein BOQ06_23920 [Klebsiella pneumoniae]